MIFKEALRLTYNLGTTIYTHIGEPVVIKGWRQNFENPHVKDDLYFMCVDSMFNTREYRYNELCGPELCDEDKMFIDWYINNNIDSDDISTLKSAFMAGFSNGYSHKQKARSEDQLQK
jgi:hypothetical protein